MKFSEDYTRHLVANKFGSPNDTVQLATDYFKLSLICPLSKKRISMPGRGISCTHVECFDIESYVMTCVTKSNWNCPICNKPVPPDSLRTDIWLLKILETLSKSSMDVEIACDASWRQSSQYENEYIVLD
jgi:hypothetical protein